MPPDKPKRGPGRPRKTDADRARAPLHPLPPKAKWEEWFDEQLAEPMVDSEIPEPETDLNSLSANEVVEFKAVLSEMAQRECEALRLYEPMPEQDRFHASEAPERLILGGNQGGKTLCECVEIARAVTGQDPYSKYSLRNGRAIVVGKDLLHCSEVIFRKLFKPGAFKVIYDPELGRLRAFRPGNQWDEDHFDLAKPAPPLIPARFYRNQDISWENKRSEIPKLVIIRTTGWRLSFFSSLSHPPQGWDADIATFDEEIEHPSWYVEVAARMMARRQPIPGTGRKRFINGRFWWGATPQAGTEHLYKLFEDAEQCENEETPRIEKFDVSLMANIHMTAEAKSDFIAKLSGNEDEYNVRVLGHFAIAGSRVYPEMMPRGPHGCPAFPIPDNWTRFIAIDPGRQVCAVLFCAIPPPGQSTITLPDRTEFPVKGRKFLYDELYIKKCNAQIFAERLREKVGTASLYSMIIDGHAGRQTEIGSGITIESQYSSALKAAKFSCEKSGHKFTWGSDNVDARILACRQGLHLDADGISTWCLMHEKLPSFIKEVQNYVYKKHPGTTVCTDVPLKRNDHLMDCWGYLAMARIGYVRPKSKKREAGYTNTALEAKRKRQAAKAKKENGDVAVKLW